MISYHANGSSFFLASESFWHDPLIFVTFCDFWYKMCQAYFVYILSRHIINHSFKKPWFFFFLMENCFQKHLCQDLGRKTEPTLIYFLFLMFTYFEREHEGVAERERSRERESQSGSIYTVSAEPVVGFKLTNCEIMTWAEIKSRTLNRLSYPCTPH